MINVGFLRSDLQRFFVYVKKSPDDIPPPVDENAEDDDIVEDFMEHNTSSHLLCHANEGFYVPVDFKGKPIFDTEV